MISDQQEEQLLPIITKFVADLDGRFKEYVSDRFLIALLLYSFGQSPHADGVTYATRMITGKRHSEAYQSACWVFENILEHGCRAGGNGHHVAQDYDACFKHFTMQPVDENKPAYSYEIEVDTASHMLIRDLNLTGQRSITNAAYDVVVELALRLNGRPLYYIDSDGAKGELKIKDGLFAGYAPAPADL